ncbi:unnamed protein product [Rotaria sordida]|uniref:Cyclin-G-associated kinase n=2 Tax=Rotaria sordida TaxID=392033 RepID=A0A818NEX0_9BILA|nr:unnamed protein product [Rotaria sordida]CAF1001409.1 unnamed protein product [Rotaria sordida]CAF3605570.1 unnamed protein product [Rotaria sordida]CAF3715693.1 unnamed protein product [Rotaria sordida]
MVDIFKSAIDAAFGAGSSARISNNMGFVGGSSTTASGGVKSDFTGQIVEVGNIRLRVGNQIAEGGYALVFIAYDVKTNKEYALKRLFAADDSAKKAIAQEISFLQKLNGNPNIVPYVAAASNQDTTLRRTEYLLVTEYCSGGRLYEKVVYRKNPLEVEQVIQIYYQICRAVKHMHEQQPPIIHRDLKVENCLLTSKGFIQLCDFGSATTKVFLPDETWSVKKRDYVEDEMTKVTTPMYRAPEMLDTYNNYPINEQVDIWALGCLLYYLCFINHPFEDSAKLRILNAKYTIPSNNTRYIVLHDLIHTLLKVDPRQRPTIHTLVENIEDLAIGNDIGLNEPLTFLFNTNETINSTNPTTAAAAAAPVGNPSAASARVPVGGNHPSSNAGVSSYIPSSIKGLNTSGKSWMKSIIDTSSKVINEGVQQVKQTLATNTTTNITAGSSMGIGHHHHFEVDLSYITSKVIVMATPRDNPSELSGRQSAELIRDLLDTKHSQSYMLFSLDQLQRGHHSYRKELFHNRVIDLPLCDEKHSPRLVDLLCFCHNISSFLLESPSNTAVLHCFDGRNQIAFGTCALIAYHGIFQQVDHIVRYYESRRCAHPFLTLSQKRYIQYLCDLSCGVIEKPHFTELMLKTINLSPVPLFNRERNGCRPYVDVFNQDYKKIFSTYQEANKLRLFSATDGVCLIPLNIPFNGDLTIHVSHAPVGLSLQAHDGGIRICELTINSNFCPLNHSELSYSRYELDGAEQTEKYPPSFRLTLDTISSKKASPNDQEAMSKQLDNTIKKPQCLFKDENEFRHTIDEYEKHFKISIGDGHQYHGTYKIESPSPNRSTKLNVEQPISNISNTSSPELNRDSSSTPQSTSTSFPNPFQEQQILSNPSLQEESQTKDDIAVGTLLDITGDDTHHSQSQPINITNTENDLLNLHLDTQTNYSTPTIKTTDLLGVDFNSMSLDKPILHRNASEVILPPPIQATTIHKTEIKSSSNQNINRLDPFQDLFSSSTTQKTSSNESLATKQAAATAKLTNTPPTSTTSIPPYNINQSSKPVTPPTQQPSKPATPPTQPKQQPNLVKPNPSSSRPQSSPFDFDTLVREQSGMSDWGSKARQGTESIGVIRKAELVKEIDPIVLKVREWTEGKKRNIRALLCSLLTVTWPECTWRGCQMHELVTPDQVKKVYRKAVLHIHPDKLRDDPNEELARLIFVELNEAWSQFERETS